MLTTQPAEFITLKTFGSNLLVLSGHVATAAIIGRTEQRNNFSH